LPSSVPALDQGVTDRAESQWTPSRHHAPKNLNGGAPAADAEDMKRFTALLGTLAALAVPASAAAHMPGTDGGPAQRGCQPVNDFGTYVGATRVSCSLARQVAAGVTRGQSFARWRCTWSAGRGFGHCHGRGIRRGAIVHWAVND
jgi:hypothetical protein